MIRSLLNYTLPQQDWSIDSKPAEAIAHLYNALFSITTAWTQHDDRITAYKEHLRSLLNRLVVSFWHQRKEEDMNEFQDIAMSSLESIPEQPHLHFLHQPRRL
jgi:hypothetical protein